MQRLLALALIAAAAAGPAAAGTRVPVLRLLRAQPLTVRGVAFASSERVTLRSGLVVRRVRTSPAGAFVAVLPVDRCSGARILAVGARGDQALLRLPPIECAPATEP
jgi:hypothetical protein